MSEEHRLLWSCYICCCHRHRHRHRHRRRRRRRRRREPYSFKVISSSTTRFLTC